MYELCTSKEISTEEKKEVNDHQKDIIFFIKYN